MVGREQGGTSEKRPPNLRFDSTSGGAVSLPADSRDARHSSMPTPGGSSDWDGEYTGTTPSVKPKKKAPVKWHRWSYQRTDPNSWSSFKNVKPKQPPQETRRRRPDSLDPLVGMSAGCCFSTSIEGPNQQLFHHRLPIHSLLIPPTPTQTQTHLPQIPYPSLSAVPRPPPTSSSALR
jgi:hypothetical protein